MSKLTPKQAAIMDMKAVGIDVSVLELRKTVIVVEVEEYAYRSIDDGCKGIRKTVQCISIINF